MLREIPLPVKKIMDKYGAEFKKIFGIEIAPFAGKLWIVGISDFDIVKFDKYMRTRRTYEDKDISLVEFIEKKYGKRGKELINELISMELGNIKK